MTYIIKLIFDSLLPAICILGIAYNCLLAVNGDEGIRAREISQLKLQEKKDSLRELKEYREALALKADQLSQKSLERDRLDESARKVLSYAHPEEYVLPMAEFDAIFNSLEMAN